MPIDRDPLELDERTLRIGRRLFADVRQEQAKEADRNRRRRSGAEPIDPADIVEWADSTGTDCGDGGD